MLNTDFKILAKVLANRLKKVLPQIITTNQAYSIIGREITDMVCNIRDKIRKQKRRIYVEFRLRESIR